MALTLGTNCGFVTTAPTADPNTGAAHTIMDNAIAFKVVAPIGATKVTEIGWWCDNATEESNFEVGIYDHNAGTNQPSNLLTGASQTNAKGTTAGWKKRTGLNIAITGETTYWIAAQLDTTSTLTTTDITTTAGQRHAMKSTQTTLTNPWGTTTWNYTYLVAFYAVYETAPTGTNQWINVDDSWRQLSEAWVNVDDSWRKVKEAWINVDDVWRKLYSI